MVQFDNQAMYNKNKKKEERAQVARIPTLLTHKIYTEALPLTILREVEQDQGIHLERRQMKPRQLAQQKQGLGK